MMMDERGRARTVWFDGRGLPTEAEAVWEYVRHSAIGVIVLGAAQRSEVHLPLRTQIVLDVSTEGELALAAEGDIVLSQDETVLKAARRLGHAVCIELTIDDREQLERAWTIASQYDYTVVDFALPTNIPLELLIAQLEPTATQLLKRETSYEAMKTAFGVLERGSDGVLLETHDLAELNRVHAYLTETARGRLELQTLVVDEVRHVGMGVRGCIDTADLMTQEEGMLVGSTSGGGIFICSETHYLPYMNLRPFRVNAGAIHSYVWLTSDTTGYISELEAGSKVLCVNTSGECRELVVGRVKTEVRPLLLIKGRAQGHELNVIIQDDWHIRVMGADGKPKNATFIKPGDELLSFVDKPGRHVGVKVDETIIEQ